MSEGIDYPQKKGLAIGTQVSNYANIFLGKFENILIYTYKKVFSNFFCKYIDIINLLWSGTEKTTFGSYRKAERSTLIDQI